MNSKQRVLTVFDRKIPDRVPHFEIAIDKQLMRTIIPKTNYLEFIEKIGLDAVLIRPDMKTEIIEDDVIKDEKGSIRKRTSQDYFEAVNQVIRSEKDLKKFEFPDPYATYRLKSLKKAIDKFQGEKAIGVFLRDGWSEVRDLHGFSQSLMSLYDQPNLIKGIIRKAVEYYSELGKIAKSLGADFVFAGDDIAGRNGLIMSPDHFKEIILPSLKKLYRDWKSYGLYIIKHSDGDINKIIEYLVDAGIDCLNPIDPISGMSLEEVKSIWGDKICIMGNINCAGNLVYGTENDVIEEVKEAIRIAAPNGGYICASSNSIGRDVKPKNYIAMVKAIKKFGVYK